MTEIFFKHYLQAIQAVIQLLYEAVITLFIEVLLLKSDPVLIIVYGFIFLIKTVKLQYIF